MDQIGKYQVLDKIGTGGFAVVYKGYDPYIKRPVAIKVCLARDEETRERFHREAEIAGRLVHRNLTTVYDFGVHRNMPYLVEEYLSGEDLAHLIRRREPEILDEKVDLLLQIAGGLDYAHSQGVIHRDIKPSNVRILDNGQAKIMDFGTAKLADVDSNLTQTGMTLGTVAYLPPERLLGHKAGLNSDIFSYGVLAYELLSFRRPHSGHSIPQLIDRILKKPPVPLLESWPQCPPSLAELVHRCLEKSPADRYAGCHELIRDLERARAEHCAVAPAAAGDASDNGRLSLQLSGLLERARQLRGEGKNARARLLLEEVLEIDPGHREARRLLGVEQAGGPAPGGPAPGVPAPGTEATLEDTVTTSTAAVMGTADADDAADDTPTTTTVTGVGEDRRERRERKVREAVSSIEQLLAAGDPATARQALSFAVQLFGEFDQVPQLRRRIRDALRSNGA